MGIIVVGHGDDLEKDMKFIWVKRGLKETNEVYLSKKSTYECVNYEYVFELWN